MKVMWDELPHQTRSKPTDKQTDEAKLMSTSDTLVTLFTRCLASEVPGFWPSPASRQWACALPEQSCASGRRGGHLPVAPETPAPAVTTHGGDRRHDDGWLDDGWLDHRRLDDGWLDHRRPRRRVARPPAARRPVGVPAAARAEARPAARLAEPWSGSRAAPGGGRRGGRTGGHGGGASTAGMGGTMGGAGAGGKGGTAGTRRVQCARSPLFVQRNRHDRDRFNRHRSRHDHGRHAVRRRGHAEGGTGEQYVTLPEHAAQRPLGRDVRSLGELDRGNAGLAPPLRLRQRRRGRRGPRKLRRANRRGAVTSSSRRARPRAGRRRGIATASPTCRASPSPALDRRRGVVRPRPGGPLPVRSDSRRRDNRRLQHGALRAEGCARRESRHAGGQPERHLLHA